MKKGILLGCIADDFTGASDAASFLVQGGLRTVLYNGVPDGEAVAAAEDCEAAVIALKTRTQETASAVKDSLEALGWLREQGARQFYVKYCSTFDSTPKGNIGPICDAAMELLGTECTLLCPSLPVNGRTVRGGRLYVNGIPLDETHMKNHPLTPMWDSDIPSLMKDQSRYPCFVLDRETLCSGSEAVTALTERCRKQYDRFYLVPDYETDEDAEKIVALFGGLPLLTGGSGLMSALGGKLSGENEGGPAPKGASGQGKAILFAGSCSVATRAQVKHYLEHAAGEGIMLEPDRLLTGEQSVEKIWAQIVETDPDRILIYSSGSAGRVERTGGDRNAEAATLERTMAELAGLAVDAGFTRIIVAGGETSGAVTKKLGLSAYRIGESIAPGVPVMIPLHDERIRLVLKSGNFGQEDFFQRALAVTGREGTESDG